jgi:hypothetical protein
VAEWKAINATVPSEVKAHENTSGILSTELERGSGVGTFDIGGDFVCVSGNEYCFDEWKPTWMFASNFNKLKAVEGQEARASDGE